MSYSQQSPIFELFDPTVAEMTPLVGLWAINPKTSDPAIAFGLNSDVNVPLWRANFPSDVSGITLHLNESEAILVGCQQALSTAVERIHCLVESSGSESALAFAPSIETALPERELLVSLKEIQETGLPAHFGIGEQIVGFSQQACEQFQPFVEQLLHAIAHYAWVETQVEGRTLARTAVGWLGDVNTIWQTELNATQVSLHQWTVALALSSRDALLQIFSTAMQIALKLAVLLNVTGSAILILPAAWKFIDRVITQLREVRYECV